MSSRAPSPLAFLAIVGCSLLVVGLPGCSSSSSTSTGPAGHTGLPAGERAKFSAAGPGGPAGPGTAAGKKPASRR